MYGMGPKSLAEQLGIDRNYATALYAQYFEKFSNVAAWKTATENIGARREYAETIFGRKVPVWELQSPSQAIRSHGMRLLINAPIQGAAADYMKIAMWRSALELRKLGWWGKQVCIIMNQHDALTFEVSNSIDPNELRDILQSCVVFGSEISDKLQGYPPIRADWELGQRWGSSTSWSFNQKANFNSESGNWEVQPEPELRVFSVTLDEMPWPNEWKRFVAKLKTSPGATAVSLNTPNGKLDLPFSSHVTLSSVKELQAMFKSATVEYRE